MIKFLIAISVYVNAFFRSRQWRKSMNIECRCQAETIENKKGVNFMRSSSCVIYDFPFYPLKEYLELQLRPSVGVNNCT